jgi:hypothetical protein
MSTDGFYVYRHKCKKIVWTVPGHQVAAFFQEIRWVALMPEITVTVSIIRYVIVANQFPQAAVWTWAIIMEQ